MSYAEQSQVNAIDQRLSAIEAFFEDWDWSFTHVRTNKLSFPGGSGSPSGSERVTFEYQAGASQGRDKFVITVPDGIDVEIVVANDTRIENGGSITANVGENVTVEVNGMHSTAAENIQTEAAKDSKHKAGVLYRLESTTVDAHATEKLRLDAYGVGFTFFPGSMHWWCPWDGASSYPQPPEHPYTASGFGFDLDAYKQHGYPANKVDPQYRPTD